MSKPTLKITVTIHEDGTVSVLIEWICSNLSRGIELATPLCWGYCWINAMLAQAFNLKRHDASNLVSHCNENG